MKSSELLSIKPRTRDGGCDWQSVNDSGSLFLTNSWVNCALIAFLTRSLRVDKLPLLFSRV